MSAERYVVLGLAHVRSEWSTDVARWATSGSIPVEYLKCISAEELRARIGGGRRFSAALLDSRLPAVDRDLLSTLSDAGIVPLVVADPSTTVDWKTLGAATQLDGRLDRPALLDALAGHATLLGLGEDHLDTAAADASISATWRGRLVAVTGRPGSGRSTIAGALAQGVSHDPRYSGDVVLADLAHRAHQAMLHDAQDVQPGIQELVEAHRSGHPTIEAHRALTFDVPIRGYRLLLGLRRPRDWVTIRSEAFRSALDGLRRSARIVVADTDDDLEGEDECGSFDIEERNLLARSTHELADLVVVVANASITGLHGLVGQLAELRAFGIAGDRTVVVVNRAPRAARAKAELTRALAVLSGASEHPDPYVGPVFVSERRNVDALHRDLARFPGGLVEPPTRAVRATLDRLPATPLVAAEAEPVPIVPGSLGHWNDEEATS